MEHVLLKATCAVPEEVYAAENIEGSENSAAMGEESDKDEAEAVPAPRSDPERSLDAIYFEM